MLKKLILSLLALVVLCIGGLVAFLYAAPERFSELAFAAARYQAGLERKEITLPDGMRFAYLEGGHGEPLLLLHGFGANKDNFVQIAPHLSDRYHLIIPDLIGFGESSKPMDINYGPEVQADRLHAFLKALGVTGKVNVGGNSMGGMITMQYGLRYADETASLWLLDPAGVFSAPETEFMKVALHGGKNPFEIRNGDDLGKLLNKAFGKPPFIPRPILDVQAKEFLASKTIQEKVFNDMMKGNANTEKDVAGLTLPALIVWGDQDQFVHPAGAAILHKLLPNSQVVMMPGIGHVPMMEAPVQTAVDYINFQAGLAKKQK